MPPTEQGTDMRRRDFIKAIATTAAAWPSAARAQQAMPIVGFLGSGPPTSWEHFAAACREGLREAGYIQGQNIAIEYRWAEDRFERLPELAAELVRRQVAVIVASGGNVAPLTALSVTKTTPIVFAVGSDPVKLKLVNSLNKPGGNVTGVSFLINALGAKRLELLREMLPAATIIGALVNPRNPNAESDTKDLLAAAAALGREVHIVHVTSETEFEGAFAALAQKRIQALIVSPDVLFTGRRDRLVALAAMHKLPGMYHLRELATAGGLMSYGTSITEAHRQAGVYAGRILKGEKPADLPVIQSTKFEFIINLKTAKTLGLDIPTKVLALADEVIE